VLLLGERLLDAAARLRRREPTRCVLLPGTEARRTPLSRVQVLLISEARGPPAVHGAIRHARDPEVDPDAHHVDARQPVMGVRVARARVGADDVRRVPGLE
jgi:hypothetical protein